MVFGATTKNATKGFWTDLQLRIRRLSNGAIQTGWYGPVSPSLASLLTLSPANTLNDSITCSAVSLSVVSLVMNSINDLNVTCPVPVGSTIAKIRWNSASPLNKTRLTLVGIISRKRGKKEMKKDHMFTRKNTQKKISDPRISLF